MRFNQEKNKLSKLYNGLLQNKSQLNNKENERQLINFFSQTFQYPSVIIDTGWISKQVETNDITTIHKGELLPETLSIDYEQEIQIPEHLLSFIEPIIFIKVPPDSQLGAYTPITVENYTGDYIEVSGDGTNIYKGTNIDVDAWAQFSDEFFSENNIPLSHSKKSFRAEIDGEDIFGAEGGFAGQISQITLKEVTGTGCGGQDNTTTYTINALQGPHQFNSVDASGFSGIGSIIENNWVDDGEGGCELEINGTADTPINVPWSLGDYTVTLFNISSLGNMFTSVVDSEDITSQEFFETGRWLFYSSNRVRSFATTVGEFVELDNLPTGDMPYNNITLLRNPEGFPKTTVSNTNIIVRSSEGNIVNGNDIKKQLDFFKLADGTISTYLLILKYAALVLSPAVKDDETPDITTQNYIYEDVGGSYSLTTSEDDLKTNGTYQTERQDVQYRIVFMLKNPLVSSTNRKYKNV